MSREESRRSGISLRTLAIASAASAAATLIVPMIWRPGTLAAAAATPVIVALISEALNKPVEHVSRAGQQVSRVGQRAAERRRRPGDEDRFGLYAAERRRRRTRLAIVTGLAAFAMVAVAWTVTEFAVGESVTGGARTTYFGGKDPDDPRPASTADPEDGDEDRRERPDGPGATPEPTATPESEETPEPTATPTATPTTSPGPTPAAPGATPLAPSPTPGASPSAAPAG